MAKASEEFDKYLKHTLGGTGADVARKEATRSDDFGTRHAGRAQITSRAALRPTRRNAKDLESEEEQSEEDSEDDEDDDEYDEEEDEKNNISEPKKKGKATASSSSKPEITGSLMEDLVEDDMEEAFKQFMEFRKRAKK